VSLDVQGDELRAERGEEEAIADNRVMDRNA